MFDASHLPVLQSAVESVLRVLNNERYVLFIYIWE
jgi:hypothetical protein